MFGLECIFQVDNTLTVETYHDVALICHHALLTALEKPFLLHQLQRIESSRTSQSSQEHSAEPSSADALDDVEIFQLHPLVRFFSPDGLDFK